MCGTILTGFSNKLLIQYAASPLELNGTCCRLNAMKDGGQTTIASSYPGKLS
jgi:hypothetical protein